MPFEPEKAKAEKGGVYKTLYISEELVKKVDALAAENEVSFNKMVITMIKYCLKEMEEQ